METVGTLLVFPDETQVQAEKLERERLQRQQTEEKLQSMGLDLLNRWDELHVEAIGVQGMADALGAIARPGEAGEGIAAGVQSAAHIRAATRAVPDAIITFTGDGSIRTFNAGAERMFGFDAEEVLHRNIDLLLPAAPALIEALAAVDADDDQPPSIAEDTGRTRGGTEIEVEISMGVTEIEDIRYHAAVVRDVSERNRAKRELLRLNGSLQDQVRETEAALARLHEAQQQLVQAEKMASLGLLVAGIAHEINTPVGIAVTAASYLGDQASGIAAALKAGTLKKSQLDAAVLGFAESAEMILNNLRRAAALVQSFKQVAVDQGSEEWRQVDLAEYLAELMMSLQPRLKTTPHQVQLDCSAGLLVHTAPGALAQIISNLVMNSLIHAWDEGQAGHIRIAVSLNEGSLHIHYADDGRGIAAEALPLIFDPFYTTRRGDGGSGLGLHIVFNLVHQTLRGQIRASSPPAAGLCFDIVIPNEAATHAKS
ncbi:MAG: PAS domain-containing sensor histidine kinase [Pseudomonadota bacterium]